MHVLEKADNIPGQIKKHIRNTGYNWHKSNYARHMLEEGHDCGSTEENMQENIGKRPIAGSMRKVHRYIHNKEHNVLDDQNISTTSILFDFFAEKSEGI